MKTKAWFLSLSCLLLSHFGLPGSTLFAQTLTQQQPVVGRFGVGTTISSPSFGGIAIDPGGVASAPGGSKTNAKLDVAALRQRAQGNLPANLFKSSSLRKVSLVRLERELGQRLKSQQLIPSDMLCLAGLTRIDYIIADREHGDVILAGPAEGFAATPGGAVVGVESGRPTLLLDDLLVMLRLTSMQHTLGCSFDPDRDRLATAQKWFQASPAASSVGNAKKQFAHMAGLLGNWNVTLFGVPATSHVALRLTDADFQMKRVNLGLRRTGIRGFKSQLQLMRPGDNSMRRYWLAPRYEPIERSTDGDVFRLSGPRLQLMSQEELTDAKGNRSEAAFKEVSTEAYTRQFNKHLPELCRRIPAFAALQNVFDLAVTAALLRKHKLAQRTGWKPNLLLDSSRLPTCKCTVPTEVPSQLNTRKAGRDVVMFQMAGGVTLVPANTIESTVRMERNVPKSLMSDSAEWWWD